MLTHPGSSYDSDSITGGKIKASVVATRKTSSKYRFPTTRKEGPRLNQGRWTKAERIAFLQGLRRFGKSKWKEISTLIPTRDTTQTKTHAQTVMKLLDGGKNIFAELECYERSTCSVQKEERDTNEKEERRIESSCKQRIGLSSPTFIWNMEDFESAKALIMLKGGL